MKDRTMHRKFVTLLALGAILSLGSFVPQAKAFTPAEIHYCPAVQLVAGQSAQVSASNFSNAPVSVTIAIINSAGTVVATKNITLNFGKTTALSITNGDTTAAYSAMVEVSAANSVASDFEVFSSNGQVATLALPYINTTPAVQTTAAVRLTPGQSGVATVTNITTSSQEVTYAVLNNAGTTVLSWEGTLSPGQTMTWSFTNKGTADNGYRGVATAQAETTVTCSLLTLDSTGQAVSIQWGLFIELL